MNVLRKTPGKRTADLKVICTVSSLRSMGSRPHYRQTPSVSASDLFFGHRG